MRHDLFCNNWVINKHKVDTVAVHVLSSDEWIRNHNHSHRELCLWHTNTIEVMLEKLTPACKPRVSTTTYPLPTLVFYRTLHGCRWIDKLHTSHSQNLIVDKSIESLLKAIVLVCRTVLIHLLMLWIIEQSGPSRLKCTFITFFFSVLIF